MLKRLVNANGEWIVKGAELLDWKSLASIPNMVVCLGPASTVTVKESLMVMVLFPTEYLRMVVEIGSYRSFESSLFSDPS